MNKFSVLFDFCFSFWAQERPSFSFRAILLNYAKAFLFSLLLSLVQQYFSRVIFAFDFYLWLFSVALP